MSVRAYVTSTTCLSSSISGTSSFSKLMIRPGDTHSGPLLLHQSKSHAPQNHLVHKINYNVFDDPLTFLLKYYQSDVSSHNLALAGTLAIKLILTCQIMSPCDILNGTTLMTTFICSIYSYCLGYKRSWIILSMFVMLPLAGVKQ